MGELNLKPEHRAILQALLRQYLPDTEFWAYGSRVHGNARPWSDLDLVAFVTPEQKSALSALREALEESDLPFRVDLFAWDELPPQFQENILREHHQLQRPPAQSAGKRPRP